MFSKLKLTLVTKTYETTFVKVRTTLMIQTDSLDIGNIFQKSKHVSAIIAS